jgi:hypothetical protein
VEVAEVDESGACLDEAVGFITELFISSESWPEAEGLTMSWGFWKIVHAGLLTVRLCLVALEPGFGFCMFGNCTN